MLTPSLGSSTRGFDAVSYQSVSEGDTAVHDEPDWQENEAMPMRDMENFITKSEDPKPPPDGGLKAWMQVLSSWVLFFNTWGILATFGVYQTYYESGVLWKASSSEISWIGSIQAFALLVGAAFVGPIYDRGHLRILLAVGTVGITFGQMMLSLTKEYWQVFLVQGIVIGISSPFLFVPSLAVLSGYFKKRIGLAVGLAASGSSLGGIVYPIMFYELIDVVGFSWSVRVLGFTMLALLALPLALMKNRVQPGKVRSIIDRSVFTDFPFLFFTLGGVFGFVGVYSGNFYTSFYGKATGLTDARLSFYLVPILNAGSVFGRTLPNALSDKIGAFNVLIPGSLFLGTVLLCYVAVTNAAGLIVCAVLFGFVSGVFIGIPPLIMFALTKDKSKVGTRIGMGFAIISCGAMAGGPGSGGILGAGKDLRWTSMWTYAGILPLAAAAIFLALRFVLVGMKLKVKV